MTYDPTHESTIQINDNTLLFLKYPKMSLVGNLETVDNETDLVFEILRNCLEKIVQGSETYEIKDSSREEVDEFILSLDVSSFNKVQNFFNTMPKLRHEINYKNSLGNDRKIVLQNLNDFFTLG